jgi:hypothetical protein
LAGWHLPSEGIASFLPEAWTTDIVHNFQTLIKVRQPLSNLDTSSTTYSFFKHVARIGRFFTLHEISYLFQHAESQYDEAEKKAGTALPAMLHTYPRPVGHQRFWRYRYNLCLDTACSKLTNTALKVLL